MRSLVKALALSLCLIITFGVIGCSTGDTEETTNGLITKEASELVLTMDDLEAEGIWTENSAWSTTNERTGSQSACAALYRCNTRMRIEVAVYPSVHLAKDVYSNEIPTKVSVTHPTIGDQCFLDKSAPEVPTLVFRRKNVVVWVVVRYYGTQGYARMVEAKINAA